jgi:type III restriction enzyme
MGKVTAIDLEKLPDGFRLQRLVFQAARKTFAELSHGFTGTHEYLAAQLVRIVEAFLNSDRLDIPSLFHSDPLRRRILIALNIDLVVQHVLSNVTEQNTERLTPVFDEESPIGATGLMRTWYTTKPCFPTTKSHISHLVGDTAWEGHAANAFEKSDDVLSYAKNDHWAFRSTTCGRAPGGGTFRISWCASQAAPSSRSRSRAPTPLRTMRSGTR